MSGSSGLRQDQANAVRDRIFEGVLEVIERGEEPSMRAVAQAAGVSERTLYRYFPSREELHRAVMPVIRERASTHFAVDVDGLPDYVRRLYTTFDRYPELARALTRSPWVPTTVTRPANLEALRKVIDEAFPRVPARVRESAAASLRVLYSAAGWSYLADCGFDLEASIRHVRWITKTVLDALETHPGGSHAPRGNRKSLAR